nr:NADH dehydrogenase subunit 4, mitochondrial [Tanacetum cinerariifolium]
MVKNSEAEVKFFMFPRFVQVFINHQLGDMSYHNKIFVTPSLTKKVFASMKREGKGFSGIITPLFETIMVQAPKEVGEGLEVPTDTHHTSIVTQPSSSQPRKKQKSRRKQSGEDRMKLNELMNLCTNLQKHVLDLEKAKTAQAKEIVDLKKRVKKLERKKKSRTSGRMIDNIDQNEEITLVDETQGRINEEDMFGLNDLDGDKVIVDATAGEEVEQSTKVAKKEVSTADPVTTAGEVVTTAEDVKVTTAATTPQIFKDELTLAQTLIDINAAKPKARGVIVQEPSEFRTTSSSQPSQLPQAKDKEVARKLEAQMKAEMEEEERDNEGKVKENSSRNNRLGLIMKEKSHPAIAGGLLPLSSSGSSWRGDLRKTGVTFCLKGMVFSMSPDRSPTSPASYFIGEFLMLVGALQRNSLVTTLAALGMILGMAYSLWLYNRVVSGNLKPDFLHKFSDLNGREVFIFIPFLVGVVWMGLYPKVLSDCMHISVLVRRVEGSDSTDRLRKSGRYGGHGADKCGFSPAYSLGRVDVKEGDHSLSTHLEYHGAAQKEPSFNCPAPSCAYVHSVVKVLLPLLFKEKRLRAIEKSYSTQRREEASEKKG